MRSRDEIRFRMPVPSTGKNSRRFAVRNGKSAFVKSDAARASAKQALAAAMEACPTPWPLFGRDDVAVEIVHHVAADEIEVVMRRVGPPPADERERSRDLQNLADVLLDAVQGVVYENDNAVVGLTMRRVGSESEPRGRHAVEDFDLGAGVEAPKLVPGGVVPRGVGDLDELNPAAGIASGAPAGRHDIERVGGLDDAGTEEAALAGKGDPPERCEARHGSALGGAAGLAGVPDGSGLLVEHRGEAPDGRPAGVVHEPVAQLPQACHAELRTLGGLGEGPALRVAASLDEGQEGPGSSHGHGPVAESGVESNSRPLAMVAESSYKCDMAEGDFGHVEKTPNAAALGRDSGARGGPELEGTDPMTTLVPSPAPRKIEAMPEAVAALEAAGFFCNDAAYIYESCDGWACWAVPVYDGDSGPGIRPGWRGADTSDPWLTCRESWDADHAGKEPTVEALREAQERERGKIDDDAIEHGEREYGRHPWRR